MEIEKWRNVSGYEGIYEVSNLGNVRSVDRVVVTKRGPKMYKGITLNSSLSSTGYKEVRLHKQGKAKTILVHRLVACAFLSNPDNLPIVNHKDGNKLNSESVNLEWASYGQNNKHAYDYQFNKQRGILNPEHKEKIKEAYRTNKITQSELAKAFNVSQNTISRVTRK